MDNEGWTWLQNSSKWHYFRNKRSLCKRWSLFLHPSSGYQQGGLGSPDNCKLCLKYLKKEQKDER